MDGMQVHVSPPDGSETVISWEQFCARVRAAGQRDSEVVCTPATILIFDADDRPTFVIHGTGYTILPKEG